MNMRTELEAKILVAKEQAYYVNHYANMLADIAMDFDHTPEAVIAFVSRSMDRTLCELKESLGIIRTDFTFIPIKGNEEALEAIDELWEYNADIADMATGKDLDALACDIESTIQSMEAYGTKLYE